MTVPKTTAYPADLTKAEWLKKKKVGSVGGEPPSIYAYAQSKINTGLGEALTEAQTAWNAIDWNQLNAKKISALDHKDGPLAATKIARLKAEQQQKGPVKTAIDKLKAAKTKADAAGKHKLLSKQANTAAKNIATKLQTQLTALESITLTDFDSAVQDWENYYQSIHTDYRKGFQKVSNSVALLSRERTADGWDKAFILNAVADVNNTLKNAGKQKMAELVRYGSSWGKITTLTSKMHEAFQAKSAQVGEQAIQAYLAAVNEELQKVTPT